MKLMKDMLSLMKEDGFTNTRLSGSHPGITLSYPGAYLEFPHTDFDSLTLGTIGYGKSKVHQLVRSYLDPKSLTEWKNQLVLRMGDKKRSIDSDVVFFPHGKHGHERGPCLSTIGFRSPGEEGPCLTVTSRSAEFPHKFLADLWMICGLCHWLGEYGLTTGSVKVRWFISLVWMDCRTANLLRASPLKINPPYSRDQKFNFRVDQQWEDYIISGREVSFSTLKNLVALYKDSKSLSTQVPSELGKFL